MQESRVLQRWTQPIVFLWTVLCAPRHSHTQTEKGHLHQTVRTKLGSVELSKISWFAYQDNSVLPTCHTSSCGCNSLVSQYLYPYSLGILHVSIQRVYCIYLFVSSGKKLFLSLHTSVSFTWMLPRHPFLSAICRKDVLV